MARVLVHANDGCFVKTKKRTWLEEATGAVLSVKKMGAVLRAESGYIYFYDANDQHEWCVQDYNGKPYVGGDGESYTWA